MLEGKTIFIPDQYLKKNKKVIKLLELWQLWLKKEKKRRNSEYKSVVSNSLPSPPLPIKTFFTLLSRVMLVGFNKF